MPDPAGACQAVADAIPQAQTATTKCDSVLARIPADVATWRFPPASALYDDTRFVRCQPYIIELVSSGSGSGEGTAAASSPWVIGQPGEPALLFPGPEQTDRSELQQLGLHLPSFLIRPRPGFQDPKTEGHCNGGKNTEAASDGGHGVIMGLRGQVGFSN